MNVTKHEICDKIALKHGMRTTQVALVVNEFLRGLANAFAVGAEVELRGFGVFRLSQRSSKVAHDLRLGASAGTREHTYVSIRFKPGRGLKSLLAKLQDRLEERDAEGDEETGGDE